MDIHPNELKERLDAGETLLMIDVREPHEWEMQTLEGVKTISLGEIPGSLGELAAYKDAEIIMICRSGGRSGQACNFLRSSGFTNARNLAGGMMAWKAYIDPTFVL